MQAKTKDKTKHYADALLAIAKAADAVESIEKDAHHLLKFLKESESLQRFFATATVATSGKRQALQEILEDRIHPVLIDFSTMLLTANDISLLPHIAQALTSRIAEGRECVSGEIHTSIELDSDTVLQIENEVSRILDKQVSLQPKIVPGILGGMLVKVGDFVIDGTVDKQLEMARLQLLA